MNFIIEIELTDREAEVILASFPDRDRAVVGDLRTLESLQGKGIVVLEYGNPLGTVSITDTGRAVRDILVRGITEPTLLQQVVGAFKNRRV